MSNSEIRLHSINVVVTEVAASRAFYAHFGLDFANAHDEVWSHHHISAHNPGDAAAVIDFDLDSTSFAPKWNQGWRGGPGVVLGFSVPTRQAVDDLVRELVAEGTEVQQEPYDAFWGARYAIVTDPDGQSVAIMSPLDDAFRSAPPDPS
jgi:predicted lactoylglutathione lyase